MNVNNKQFKSTVVYTDDYEEKQPKLKNLYYYYIRSIVDNSNRKISNGIVVYEILKLNSVGDHNDVYDRYEEDLEIQLVDSGLSYSDIDKINNYSYYKNVKSKLKTNIENNHADVNPRSKYGKKIRLPKDYYDKSEEIQGKSMSDIIYDSIEFYISHPFDSRHDRIGFKKNLLKYFDDNMTPEFTQVEKDIVDNIVDSEVDGISEDYIINNIKTASDYINNSDKLTRWGDRTKALENVIKNSSVDKDDIKDIIKEAHGISIYGDVEDKIDNLLSKNYSYKNVNNDILDYIDICSNNKQIEYVADINDKTKATKSNKRKANTVLRSNNISKYKIKNYNWDLNRDTIKSIYLKLLNSKDFDLTYDTMIKYSNSIEEECHIMDLNEEIEEEIELDKDNMTYYLE